MLKKLRLNDFKSFADASVELAPLTLLVGANASGKSNLLDALRFLHGTVWGLSIHDILNGDKRGVWPGIRGGAAEAARIGKSSFTLESTWEVVDEPGSVPTTTIHEIVCRTSPSVGREVERFINETGEEILRKGPMEEVLTLPQALVAAFHTRIGSLQFLDLQPSVMRGYGRSGDDLGTHGTNLSGVLHDLCSDPSRKQTLVDWLAELCAPELADIDFIRVEELGDVMAMLVEKDGRRISVRSLSDGTLRFLGTLVALFVAEPNTIFCIEEIAEGLHPARIGLLMEWLLSLHRERGIQIIATTHSPTVLRWLDDETLGNTVLFARVPEHEGTIMRRLRDLPRFFDIVREAGIEEMFTTSWLELAL